MGGGSGACAARQPVLINVGRGDLLAEQSVLEALDAGWLRAYVGDVFAPEPLAADSRLWAHPQVLASSSGQGERST